MKRYSFVQQLEDVIRSASFIVLGMMLMAGVGHVMASPTSAPPDNSALAPKFSELTISNTLDVGEGITVGEGISVGGQLTISGFSSFDAAQFKSDVSMMADLHVDNDIDVDGKISANDFNVGGTLYFDGEAFDPNATGDFEEIQAQRGFFDKVEVAKQLDVSGELITDRLFTDSIETTGHLDIAGGVTARDFGVYTYYYASIADNQGTVITQGCPDEILIACSGYSSATKTNYKGTFINNNSEQGLVCQSERTDQRGTLWVMAYCHNSTELPNNP